MGLYYIVQYCMTLQTSSLPPSRPPTSPTIPPQTYRGAAGVALLLGGGGGRGRALAGPW